MRLTIVRDDNIVVIDGMVRPVDCSSLAPNIHAVQWYDDHGEIEFNTVDDDGIRAPNEAIADLSEFQAVIDQWGIIGGGGISSGGIMDDYDMGKTINEILGENNVGA